MHTNDTQQEHSYDDFIQKFSFLFNKIKEKDESIYTAVASFNVARFLIEYGASWRKDKNEVYEVFQEKFKNMEEAKQEIQEKAKKELSRYIEDGVEEVSIYGNCAEIKLKADDKKEFKISEFLNSDFCEKNEISGFSTLHSDGKSGMHGFVHNKIRHYVVTDGSYEMTLKWYGEKGEEYKIKINIKADGVEFIEGNITEKDLKDELKMNKDVKIGGLFLHEIKFREKGKVNEMQHDGKDNQVLNKSSEIAIKSNSRGIEQEVKKPVQKHQATHMNREIGSQTPPLTPLRTSSLKKDVFDEQGGSELRSRKPDRSEQIPNNQQKGATSDPSDGSTFTKSVSHNQDNRQEDERYDNPTFATFGHAVPGSQKPDRSEQTPNDQQQPEIPQQEGNSKGDLLQDIRNFKRNSLRRTGVVDGSGASMEGGRKNESTSSILETLKDKVPYLPYSNIHEHDSDNRGASDAEWEESKQPLSVPKPNSKSDSGYSPQIHAQPQVDPEQPKRSLENIEQSDQTPPENLLKEIRDRSQQDNRGLRQVDPTDKLSQDKEDGLQKDDLADVKTVEGPTVSVSASTPNSISDSGYSSPTHANHKQPQVNPGQLKASLMNVEQRDDTLLTEFTSKLDKETQKFPLKPVDQEEQTKEHLLATGLLKENAAETKINDSGHSSPTYTSHYNFQVSPEQLGKRLETIESKKEETLEKLNKGLKEPSQQATKTKDLFLDSMLEKIKEGKQYDPVRKLLERKVAEQENNDTNSIVDKNSNLYKLLEKDEAQLKIGVIEEERKDTLTEHTDSYDRNRIALGNRNKRPLDWAKRIAESQEKDTNKSILM
ncbi:hypothetical protein [Wolbachia endosymbiont (group A) of Agelastica alni]|uniref:hypothetical protein n=1 Tax=Wolbachia endosymbiont (group A) of Agelastica alni TaxID=3066130 RepID=UPI00334260EC